MGHTAAGETEDLVRLRPLWDAKLHFPGRRFHIGIAAQDRSKHADGNRSMQVISIAFKAVIVCNVHNKIKIESFGTCACHTDLRAGPHPGRNPDLNLPAIALDLPCGAFISFLESNLYGLL